jgi:ribosome-associated protein
MTKARKSAAAAKPPAAPGPSEALRAELTASLQEKKAKDIVLLDLRKVNPYFDYFVIASAGSRMQLKSMARDMQKKFSSLERKNSSISADDVESGWMVLDFIDVVVHLFLEEQRGYYNLERLWGDAKITRI